MTETNDFPQRVNTTMRSLLCKLSKQEWQERASRLATVNQEIADEEARQQEQKAAMKARLATLDAERQTLAGVVVRHEEMREVECVVWHHDQPARVVTVRMDTNDEIENRPMTDFERQRFLPVEA